MLTINSKKYNTIKEFKIKNACLIYCICYVNKQ